MPPVLDISFPELAARAQQQVFAHQSRLGMDERHHVLQLVAETERAAGLIVPAARPQSASLRLIQKPAVGEYVEGRIGCLHLYGA